MRILPLFLLLACGAADDGTDEATTDSGNTEETGEALSCDGITPAVTNLTPAELSAMLDDKDFELINVHIPDEGQIPGTDVHIAYTNTDGLSTHLGGDVAAKVVLYCKTGPMSEIAADDLIDRGFCRVYDMPAGMNGWEDAGYTLE